MVYFVEPCKSGSEGKACSYIAQTRKIANGKSVQKRPRQNKKDMELNRSGLL